MRLVHSAVDAAACQPDWAREQFRTAFDLQGDELAVVCVAQLIPRKGQRFLLDAWPERAWPMPAGPADLVRAGSRRSSLARSGAAGRLKRQRSLRWFQSRYSEFPGPRGLAGAPGACAKALGICLLEAQAAGLPVVATRAGGIPEAVAEGVSGVLVPPQDSPALAAAITAVLSDPDERARLGAGGRAHTWRRIFRCQAWCQVI